MPTEDMEVEVRDRLTGIRAIVGDDAIAAVEQMLLARDLDRQVEEFGSEIGIGSAEIPQRREVGFGHDENVSRCLRLKVPEGHGSRRLSNERGVEFTSRDATEDTLLVALRSRHVVIWSSIL